MDLASAATLFDASVCADTRVVMLDAISSTLRTRVVWPPSRSSTRFVSGAIHDGG